MLLLSGLQGIRGFCSQLDHSITSPSVFSLKTKLGPQDNPSTAAFQTGRQSGRQLSQDQKHLKNQTCCNVGVVGSELEREEIQGRKSPVGEGRPSKAIIIIKYDPALLNTFTLKSSFTVINKKDARGKARPGRVNTVVHHLFTE